METCYKVVRVVKECRNEIKTSLFAEFLPEKLNIVYKYNRWIHADPVLLDQGFGICVFRDYDDAYDLSKESNIKNCEIWECKIVPMENPNPKRFDLNRCESINYHNINKAAICWWPSGTVLSESIKLTQRCCRQILNKE